MGDGSRMTLVLSLLHLSTHSDAGSTSEPKHAKKHSIKSNKISKRVMPPGGLREQNRTRHESSTAVTKLKLSCL